MNTSRAASRPIPPTFWLSLILLAGFTLRIYQLGHDSFWNDEVGVAEAAREMTFSEMLGAAHNHVMAMPLDYAVVWGFARLNTSEAFLRLPAALWGSLSVVLAYGFFSRLANRRVGLLAALLLAVSPLHVQYSQELRFYASLTFFYLAASWALLRAIEEPHPTTWVTFTLVTVLGIFFHVYVILVLASGMVWLALKPKEVQQITRQRKYFIRSSAVILVAFLIGVVLFGGVYSYDIPLVLEDSSLLSVIGIGLGWLPFYTPRSGVVLAWGIACAILEVIAIGCLLLRRSKSLVAGLFYGLVIQVGAIIVMNVLKHYFIAPRQLILFLPVMLLFAALGLDYCIERVKRLIVKSRISATGEPAVRRQGIDLALASVAVILVLALSLPALRIYYQGDKGRAREISEFIQKRMQSNDLVLVIPDFEVEMILYYYEEMDRSGTTPAIYGADWDDLVKAASHEGVTYLVTQSTLSSDQTGLLTSFGFQPVYSGSSPSRYARVVWANQ